MNNSQYHIINKGACDYLRTTTFDSDMMEKMAKIFQTMSINMPIKSLAKNMQYVGYRIEQLYLGKGKQRGQQNMMLEASGATAEDVIKEYRELDRCDLLPIGVPRLDVQFTIERIETDENLSALGNRIREMQELHIKNPAKRPKIRLRDNSKIENDNTVYVGSRTSDRMVRIYDKKINNKEYIRYEIEYHDKVAGSAFNELMRDEHAANGLLRGDMARFVRYSTTVQRLWESIPTEESILPTLAIRDQSDENKRLEYLEFMARAMARRLTLEGFGPEVEFILKSILDEVGELKR